MTNEGVFRRLRGALLGAGALAVAAGCAGLATANKKSPGQVVNGQFKPALPPSPTYGPDPKLTCPDRGVNGALKELIDKEDLKGKKMIPDGRLCAVAETMLGWTPA